METAMIKIVHHAILTVTTLACWDPTGRMFLSADKTRAGEGTSESCAGINNSSTGQACCRAVEPLLLDIAHRLNLHICKKRVIWVFFHNKIETVLICFILILVTLAQENIILKIEVIFVCHGLLKLGYF